MITAGGTRKYIDDVRVMTNISTGKLGSIIAEQFLHKGHEVYYVHTKNSVMPEHHWTQPFHDMLADSVGDAYEVMEQFVPEVDAVIHSMAVSDFTFNRDNPVKLKSNDIDGFVEYIKQNMVKAPKILPMIKQWNPDAQIMGFKFEVGKTKDELFEIARAQMVNANTDFTLANDKKMMQDADCHIGWLMDKDGNVEEARNKNMIACMIYNAIVNENV